MVANIIEIDLLNNKIRFTISEVEKDKDMKEKSNCGVITECTKRQEECLVDLLRNMIDIPVSIAYLYPQFLDPTTVGVLGTITSCIGCYQNWPSLS